MYIQSKWRECKQQLDYFFLLLKRLADTPPLVLLSVVVGLVVFIVDKRQAIIYYTNQSKRMFLNILYKNDMLMTFVISTIILFLEKGSWVFE